MKHFKMVLPAMFLSSLLIFGFATVSMAEMDSMVKQEQALGGFCPTCLIHGMKMKGSSEYTTVYEGKTYMFTSAQTKEAFDANPAANAKEARMKYDAMMGK